MPRIPRPSTLILLAAFVCVPLAAGTAELSDGLRTASELYRAGRLDEAREEALTIQRFFPDDLEALLILGRIDFDAGRHSEAKGWFRAASAKSPRHPIVRRYRKLIEELEYRNGPFDASPAPLPAPDKGETAMRFKKAWFGPIATEAPADLKPPAMEPVLSREPLWVTESDAQASPPSGGSSGAEFATAGEDALKDSFYLKSYIMYSQALARTPDHAPSRLGFARAAIGMGKYAEALEVLEPLLSIGAPPDSSGEARALAGMAHSLLEPTPHSH